MPTLSPQRLLSPRQCQDGDESDCETGGEGSDSDSTKKGKILQQLKALRDEVDEMIDEAKKIRLNLCRLVM